MYRLNVNLSDALGEKLCQESETTGTSKVSIVSAALDAFFKQRELQNKIWDRLSDPAVLAEMCKNLGISAVSDSETEK